MANRPFRTKADIERVSGASRSDVIDPERFSTRLAYRPESLRDGSVVSSLHCMNDPQVEGHMASHIERRKFLATLGGAAAWPLAARAQQAPMPVVGYLNLGSPESDVPRLTGLRRGLSQTG